MYRVDQKSKLSILSQYVNKTEKIVGMWTDTNSHRENEAYSDIFNPRVFYLIFFTNFTHNTSWLHSQTVT